MKKLLHILLLAASLYGVISCNVDEQKVIQISKYWNFNIDIIPSRPNIPDNCTDGFTVRFNSILPEGDSTLLDIPGVLQVRKFNSPDGGRINQNYIQFKMPDGSLPVLQADLTLDNKLKKKGLHTFSIGIPVSLIDTTVENHDIVFQFTGATAELYVDSELVDMEAVLGYPVQDTSKKWIMPDNMDFYTPALKPARMNDMGTIVRNIQYWSPDFYNVWVGDVVSYYYKGRYHLFYLVDRRHHKSKLGGGGHWFEHLSTTDFITWTEHKPVLTIDEQWQSVGTGLPFEDEQGRLCLSLGWHTGRFCEPETTTYDSLMTQASRNGYVDPIKFDDTQLVPEGSTWYICTDNIDTFEPSGIIFHHCENPGIFRNTDKGYTMYAANKGSGTWKADSLESRWTCIDTDFPPGGDCTFPFRWGKYDYLVGGFKDAWFKLAEDNTSAFKVLPDSLGNCYDGLAVPCITEIPSGRFITAGWTRNDAWGGYLAIHELIQHPDGTLGVKWMSEVTPKTDNPYLKIKDASNSICAINRGQSCIISFDIIPDTSFTGSLEAKFADSLNPGDSLLWQLDFASAKAQFCGISAEKSAQWSKTVSEGTRADKLRDYCIEGGFDCKKAIHIRMAVYCNSKCSGALYDVEIGGERVMMNYRPELLPDAVNFACNSVRVKNLKIAPFKE